MSEPTGRVRLPRPRVRRAYPEAGQLRAQHVEAPRHAVHAHVEHEEAARRERRYHQATRGIAVDVGTGTREDRNGAETEVCGNGGFEGEGNRGTS